MLVTMEMRFNWTLRYYDDEEEARRYVEETPYRAYYGRFHPFGTNAPEVVDGRVTIQGVEYGEHCAYDHYYERKEA